MNSENLYRELLAVLSEEDLLRLIRRFQLRGNNVMARLLENELEERELGRT